MSVEDIFKYGNIIQQYVLGIPAEVVFESLERQADVAGQQSRLHTAHIRVDQHVARDETRETADTCATPGHVHTQT